MAGRILANLIVMGSGVLLRAASQAYRQAIINGTKAGVTAETAAKQAAGKATMSAEEARLILGIDPNTPSEEVMKKFKHLWDVNDKHGSFYILSKVYRAMEAIDPQVAELARLDYVATKQREHEAKMNGSENSTSPSDEPKQR
mmetsp:Transcript_19107/g.36546  ORF Transcript_19107/g.36546 Transcript_19107/m.36546 type:complete len:143 (-) Transcript_19107:441-869(-)|eukprot:CAMPEP_0114250854 /NCGR_PEP_ID=MMETSP0058-20121206/14930_1 /TAXON_ID=36894 /ORGANISM="Pyramimonas parkeae, CCMP726" /LENGTH=142 /DNA_ID=CAMNT_0001364559 /DNA_START=365 /DNA_END=793 /DNA_ORIENTATION=-